ncbi:MAG: peptidylprolyl isomerase [Bacteroidales bacterium]
MKKIPGLLILFLICFFVQAQNQTDEALIKIDNEEITKDEFLRFYEKNKVNLSTGETISVDEYLDLFVNFKLKVIEAKNRGLDTSQAFINEFKGYKEQLAKPYLLDPETVDSLAKEAYERMQIEVRASHILVRIPVDATPEDTIFAYKKARDIRSRILRGEPFHVVAKGTSDDPSVKNNGGDLGYFTVFQMVYPFENAVYHSEVNEVTRPVRTRFGYHIIKVTDKRKSQGEIKVAHIMLAVPKSLSPKDANEKKELINELYHRLMQGDDFNDLARKYSEDRGSANLGGELPWFGVGQMIHDFEMAAFELEKNGEISKPVKTNYGWHIIKRIDRKKPKSFQNIKEDLKRKVIHDSRASVAREALIEKLKDEYHFQVKESNIPGYFDTTENVFRLNHQYIESKFNIRDTLFILANQVYTINDFEGFVRRRKGRLQISPYQYYRLYNDFVDHTIIKFEESKLEQKYPDYKYLLKEYYEGMLLFELTDQEIWSKAIKDTVGLQNYYNRNKSDYMWDERWKGSVYYCDNKEVYQKVKKEVNKRSFGRRVKNSDLLNNYNEENEVLKIETGLFNKGENKFIDQMVWDEKSDANDKIFIIVKGERVKPTIKSFNEARGQVISDYQEYLEKQWVNNLHNKYNIQINNKVLTSIKKNIKN